MKQEIIPGNLRAENGDDPHVALNVKNPQTGQFALLAPLGNLLWTQRLAPLNLELERLQNVPLAAPNSVTVTAPGQDPNGPREQFNLGMYLNLSDAERMDLNARVEDHLSGGSALAHVTALDWGMPPALFLSAARRLLRPGTARARLAKPDVLAWRLRRVARDQHLFLRLRPFLDTGDH